MNCEISVQSWKKLLNIQHVEEFSVITALDLPNQRVIQSDVERTRPGLLNSAEGVNLELLLTYYCKENNTSYKQGMNEIMAPFLCLTRSDLPIHMVYTFFKQFVHSVLGNMFVDHEFRPLQAMFLIFRLLLRYHEPRISSFFQFNHVSPECYLTSWILTIFASKISDVQVLYILWQEILKEQDKFFLLFLSLAFLQHFKTEIVKNEEIGISCLLGSIEVDNAEVIFAILEKARRLKSQMPYSALVTLGRYDVYDLENVDSLMVKLEQAACVSVMPREVICRAFPESKVCTCERKVCVWCVDHTKSVPLILIDCRTERQQSQGTLPNSLLLRPEAFYDTDFMLEFPDQFVSMRGVYHFCLMGTSNYKGSGFEFKTENPDHDIVENMISNLLQAFLMKGFQYLSVLDGGFERIHHFAKNFKLDLDNHKENICALCEPPAKKRDVRRSSAGDVGKAVQSFGSEEKVVEREMQGFCHAIFFCKVESVAGFVDCCLKIGEKVVEAVPCDEGKEVIRGSVSLLSNIVIMKKNPAVVSLSFKDLEQALVVHMKSKDEVKKCVGQVSSFYNKSLGGSQDM